MQGEKQGPGHWIQYSTGHAELLAQGWRLTLLQLGWSEGESVLGASSRFNSWDDTDFASIPSHLV